MAAADGSTLRPVLLVDDERVLLEATRQRIERALPNARLLAFTAGTDALDGTRGISLGMAILDIDMPGLSGLELAEELLARSPDLPVLFVTGTSQDDLEDHLRKLGAVGCLRKPASGTVLVDAILAHARRV